MKKSLSSSEIGGLIRAPASKSSMQRAVACATLAEGESLLLNPSLSADCLAALSVAGGLGARVERREGGIAIRGGLDLSPWSEGRETRRLVCGESGLCIRMFTPIASLLPGESLLVAEGSLRKRPLSMLEGALDSLGATCVTTAGLPPVLVRGPLRGGKTRVDGRESSQFVTGLLIALAAAELDSEVFVEGLVSGGYVDLTIDTMRRFGVEARRGDDAVFSLRGRQSYKPTSFEVEGDWSGAAFLVVAAAIAARSEALAIAGLRLDSSQPDRAILRAVEAAGAALSIGEGGVSVASSRLEAFEFDATDCPDLFPPLVALASACRGESLLRGAKRLGNKESDRAMALREEFGRLGVAVAVDGDEMRVSGRGRIFGGAVDSQGDHRIAMAAAVASLVAEEEVVIEGAECVSKSWPSFFEDLDGIRRKASGRR
ncbi:MAG TPA: 3-phosphoshikimate 1-carboxyvinyltransferase [Rectinemataceae bacterium]|nr:3-phosphoshikimate 1-carboxyvinyltransferase [Rectinemataceae bacterium]